MLLDRESRDLDCRVPPLSPPLGPSKPCFGQLFTLGSGATTPDIARSNDLSPPMTAYWRLKSAVSSAKPPLRCTTFA
jgi:hypothetical protein